MSSRLGHSGASVGSLADRTVAEASFQGGIGQERFGSAVKETDQRSVLNELPPLMSRRLSRLLNERQRLHVLAEHTAKLKVEHNYVSFVLAGICVFCGDRVLCRQRSLCSSPARIPWLTGEGETLIYNRRGGKKKREKNRKKSNNQPQIDSSARSSAG